MNKKRSVRWSRVIILVFCGALLIATPIYVYQLLNKTAENPEPPVVEQPETVKILISKGYPEEIAIKVNSLTNQEKIDYLKTHDYVELDTNILLNEYSDLDKLTRYQVYKSNHEALDIYKVILNVNLHLDYDYYENTQQVEDPNSLYVIVNKYFYLSKDYEPDDLVEIKSELNGRSDGMKVYAREEAVNAFYKMNDAMESEIGLVAKASTAYRDYAFQEYLYNYYVSTIGEAKADLESARPGYSEHQTGLAIDVNANGEDIEQFVNSQQNTWVVNNAHLYGFIVRYQEATTETTGYRAEEWHLRYVGVESATAIYNQGITLEEYVMRMNHGQ